MLIVRGNEDGMSVVEKRKFLGVNGWGRYEITLNQLLLPQSQIITHHPNHFPATIPPQFIPYQIPIPLPSIKTSLHLIHPFSNPQNPINQYLHYHLQPFKKPYPQLTHQYYPILHHPNLTSHLTQLISFNNHIPYLFLHLNQPSLLNPPSTPYTPYSPQLPNLKQAFFFAPFTPTLTHLPKLHADFKP